MYEFVFILEVPQVSDLLVIIAVFGVGVILVIRSA
jgi:hypothetical protein